MTTKNAKTALFASLIAAMLLPFGSMNLAHADESEIDPVIQILGERAEKLEQRIENLEKKLETTTTSDEKAEKIQQLIIVLKTKLQNIIDAGEELGYMSQDRLGNPEAEFYKEHSPQHLEEELQAAA